MNLARQALPDIMVAPTGARRSKADHPALPMSCKEIVNAALACHSAGADGIHIHVRDEHGQHTLDAGLYQEVLRELELKVPHMMRQITTEAVGRFTPEQQRGVVKAVKPDAVSVSVREMLSDNRIDKAQTFYQWCEQAGIAVQHIIYDNSDLELLDKVLAQDTQSTPGLQLLIVLGRYAKNQQSHPDDLQPFMQWLHARQHTPDWAVCAFGSAETVCLAEAWRLGGKVRVGFENSLWNSDGTVARDNAERVMQLRQAIGLEPRACL